MKRLICFIAVLIFSLTACTPINNSIVGKWIDEETEATIEYTADGYYYEYANENFTSDKTRYLVEANTITYYLDGDEPESGFSVEYEIKDGHLIINGELIYRPLTENVEK